MENSNLRPKPSLPPLTFRGPLGVKTEPTLKEDMYQVSHG